MDVFVSGQFIATGRTLFRLKGQYHVYSLYGQWTSWMSSSPAASPLAQVELLPIGTLACLVLVWGRPFAS
jgi:hypothetical protein